MSEISQLLDRPSPLLRQQIPASSEKSLPSFNPLKDVLHVIEFPNTSSDLDDLDPTSLDVDNLLRQLNSLEFRMQMHSQNSGSQLQKSTERVLGAIEKIQARGACSDQDKIE